MQHAPVAFVLTFEARLKAGNRCGMHAHQEVEIVFHPSGRGVTRFGNGKELHFGPGDVVILAAGEFHDQWMETMGVDKCILMKVFDQGIREKLAEGILIKGVKTPSILRDLDDWVCWQEISSPLAKDFRAAALLHELLGEWESGQRQLEKPEAGLEIVLKARRIAASELTAPPSGKMIAKRLGVSHDYLRHLFKKRCGKGLKEFSLEARVERARSLLAASPMPLKEIARDCGFANERAFSSAFKAKAGCTPGEYRIVTRRPVDA